jgi:hypothetical protein
VTELRKKPDHQDNIELMETVIPLYVTQQTSQADEAVTNQQWDNAVSGYDALQQLRSLLAGLPPVPKGRKGPKTPTTFIGLVPDKSAERKTAADNSAETHYRDGEKNEAAGNMRAAAVEFRLARRYYPNYKDATDRYDKCRGKAILKVCVMPFEDKTGKSYGALGDVLTEQVISKAMEANPEFIQFVTRNNVQELIGEQNAGQSGIIDPSTAAKVGKLAGVHSFVFGKLLTINENFPADIVQNGQNATEQDTKQGKIYKRCAYTLHKREGKVTVTGSFQIVEVSTGAIKVTDKIEDVESDHTSWVTFSGDEDAIPYEIVQQNLGERALQTPQELASTAVNKIGTGLAEKLLSRF